VFTTNGTNLINGMRIINTLANFPKPAARVALALVGMLWLVSPALVFSQEESGAAADRIMAAEEALKDHRFQDAAREYRLAAEASQNPEVAKSATRVAYTYGFNDEALRSARRWAELAPDDDEAILYVAQLNLRTGEIREARREFEKLLAKGDQPADESLLRLVPVLAQEDAKNAYALMVQLAKPYKESAYAHYAVAVLALDAGETKIAGERAKEAIELEPDWIKPHLVYARSLLLSGDLDGAIDYVSRLVGDDPDPDPEARLELAIMYVSADRDDDALSQVNQVLLEQPYRTDALRLMAIINFRQEHLDAARADFEDLLASGDYQMDAYYYLGRIADLRAEHVDAVRYYTQVTSGGNAVFSQSRAAAILAKDGKPEKALELLDHFAEINPNYAVDMLRSKAQVLASTGRHEEALEYFDEVIKYRPDDEGMHLSRAELLLRMGRIEDSISEYRVAVKRWPDSATSLNALGYTLADRTKEYDEAEKLIARALKLEPDSAAIIDSWGWVLYRQGRNEEALGYLQDAYERLRDPEVAAHIVEVLWALDRHDDAQQALEDAERLFPESELLQAVRQRLMPEPP